MQPPSTYKQLGSDRGFQSFLWTQFLGAFNDNVFKIVVSLYAVHVTASGDVSSKYLAIAGAVFVLPFLLFAGYAGQIADRFSKTRVLQATKALEIPTMALGAYAMIAGRMDLMLCVLFLLALQANLFSPAKYGVLPEMMNEAGLSRANGLLELSTFVAIIAGSGFGTWLFERWKLTPGYLGATLFAVAIVGSLASLGIKHVPAAGSLEAFRLNPFAEVAAGISSLRRNKPLLWSVIGISWFWLVGALFQMSLILTGKEVLHVSETRSGLLIAALAVGIGIGSVLAGSISGKQIELGLVPTGALLMGAACVGFSLARSFPTACAWLVVVGFAGGLFAVPLNAYLQDRSDKHERGRVLATNNFVNMLGVIFSSGLLWLLHDRLHCSTSEILAGLGIFMMIGAVVVGFQMPRITVRFVFVTVAKWLFRARVEGSVPESGGVLLAANHVSYADFVLLSCLTERPIRFLMWRSIYEFRPLRGFFAAMGAIPIGAGGDNNKSLDVAREAVLAGEVVAIFPEGGISRQGGVQEFKRGFERIVDGTGCAIVPVHVGGMRRVRAGQAVEPGISAAELRASVLAVGEGLTCGYPCVEPQPANDSPAVEAA